VKRIIAIGFLITYIVSSVVFQNSFAIAYQTPEIIGEAGVLINAQTGQILWRKNEHKRMGPASTTKIMTGILALEKGDLQGEVVTSKRARYADGSRVYLEIGEKKTLEDMVYAIMLNSGNDASIAIAESIGGSVEDFAKMMNEKALEVGALDTQFTNPNGLPDPNHYSSAYDLAMIARSAMANEKFREIVSTKTRSWPGLKWFGPLINHNKLLWRYPGLNGLKTGYTVSAGQCLVASAKRGSEEYIAVVLNSKGKKVYSDVKNLLDYGFDNYESRPIVAQDQKLDEIKLEGKTLPILSKEALNYSFGQGLSVPQKDIELKKDLKLPVKQGDIVGYLMVNFGETATNRLPIIAGADLKLKRTILPTNSSPTWVGGYVILGILALLQLRAIIKRRIKKRKRILKKRI
jgi:serine-type D-Ala-D-Ala carboxypeptidase (penicillin-binding protein 5/6)